MFPSRAESAFAALARTRCWRRAACVGSKRRHVVGRRRERRGQLLRRACGLYDIHSLATQQQRFPAELEANDVTERGRTSFGPHWRDVGRRHRPADDEEGAAPVHDGRDRPQRGEERRPRHRTPPVAGPQAAASAERRRGAMGAVALLSHAVHELHHPGARRLRRPGKACRAGGRIDRPAHRIGLRAGSGTCR